MTRGQRGRQIGRAMIAFAVGAIVVVAILLIGPPTLSEPMFSEPVWSKVFTATGVVGIIVGLVWMIRIHRADPEPDQHAWRYRAKR